VLFLGGVVDCIGGGRAGGDLRVGGGMILYTGLGGGRLNLGQLQKESRFKIEGACTSTSCDGRSKYGGFFSIVKNISSEDL